MIGDGDPKETDTHWRCSSGEACFNYRLLFDFQSPCRSKSAKEAYKLKLQLFDRDLFKSNDFICEFELDLALIVKDCRATQKPIHLSRKYYSSYFKGASKSKLDIEFETEDSFWLSIKRTNESKPIRLLLDLRVLPGADAVNQRVGTARSEPNHSPQLQEPWGRLEMSMNPLKMLG